jgi:uncharacterized protein (DUF885 family)
MRPFIALIAAAVFAASASPIVAADETFGALLERYFEDGLQLSPLTATAIGDDRYNDRFPNSLSAAFREEQAAYDRRYLAELAKWDRAKLQGQDRLSYDVLKNDLQDDLDGLRFPSWLLPVNQFGGATFYVQLASGQSIQPFRNTKDYEDFLKRTDRFLVYLEQAVTNMREGVTKGVVQPKAVIEKVVTQLDGIVADDPTKSVFWGPVAEFPEGVPEADRARLREAYRKQIAGSTLPAYRRLRDFVRDEYLPRCRATVGLSALPDGAAWYAYLVRTQTTTDLTPAQIHDIGLKEVARIHGEMEAVRQQVGFKGDLHAFFEHLAEDPKFHFKTEAALLQAYRDQQKRINALLPKLFDVFPKSDYEVRPVEAFRAQSAAGASYQPGTPDGSRPGVFYVNTFDLKAQPTYGVETLSLHEASPGHHFQISLAQEITDLPRFRRFGGYNAYVEGWGLYAESIGKELGLFTDPYQWYGRLSDEMLRAMRLVVDTGLHSKGWTREQSIRYMLDNSSMAESDVVAEVERYIVIPGQALGYKIGQLALTEMRKDAEQELGKAFDPKGFHRVVLTNGALPIGVLRTRVKEWVAETKAARAGTGS